MKLLYLHGAPSTGKLTIAKELVARTDARLLDNHTAIDLALTVFSFGAPGFWDLIKELRREVISAAAKRDLPLLIYTGCYSHPEDYEQFRTLEALVQGAGGEILPVYLTCTPAELAARVGNADRAARGKLVNEEGLNQFLQSWNIAPVPRDNTFTLRSDAQGPGESAEVILRHFQLSRVE